MWVYFQALVGRCLADLLAEGCILCGEEADADAALPSLSSTLSSTSSSSSSSPTPRSGEPDLSVIHASPLGLIASRFYLDVRTPMQFRRQLSVLASGGRVDGMVDLDEAGGSFTCDSTGTQAGGVVHALLLVLCNCHEFAEVPVRHNEDVLNMQLAALLPWPVDPALLDTAHTKTLLLLQATIHGSLSHRADRVRLPISDYLNDTKSVLDQFARVHAALVEVCRVEGREDMLPALASLAKLVGDGKGLLGAVSLA